jgi:hypothetical protein
MATILNLYAQLKPNKPTTNGSVYRRIDITAQVQSDLQSKFAGLESLWGSHAKVSFTPVYKPDPDEVFEINNYALPPQIASLANAALTTRVFSVPELTTIDHSLKAILAISKDTTTSLSKFYFQILDKRHILDKKKWYPLIFLNNKYSALQQDAITISDILTAFFDGSGRLLFRSFKDSSQVLDLDSYFTLSTDTDIRNTLNLSIVKNTPAEISAIIGLCDNISRKRFSIIKHEGILANPGVTAKMIMQKAKHFGIDIKLKGSPPNQKIVFPIDKEILKLFLKLLCQDFYESILTGEKCVSNSHRKL